MNTCKIPRMLATGINLPVMALLYSIPTQNLCMISNLAVSESRPVKMGQASVPFWERIEPLCYSPVFTECIRKGKIE